MTKHILVADDMPSLRRLLQEMLSHAGHCVQTCDDGQAALDLLRNNTYALIILDYVMPRKTGFEVIRELRRKGDLTPVLLITSTMYGEAQELCEGLANVRTLPKPFTLAELNAAIEAVTQPVGC
jgi:two-component system OmpR family response regulator